MGYDRIAVKVLCDGEEGQKEITVNKYVGLIVESSAEEQSAWVHVKGPCKQG